MGIFVRRMLSILLITKLFQKSRIVSSLKHLITITGPLFNSLIGRNEPKQVNGCLYARTYGSGSFNPPIIFGRRQQSHGRIRPRSFTTNPSSLNKTLFRSSDQLAFSLHTNFYEFSCILKSGVNDPPARF